MSRIAYDPTRGRTPGPKIAQAGEPCPDCGKPLRPKKSWGGLKACYCLWGGRRPSVAQIVAAADAAQGNV